MAPPNDPINPFFNALKCNSFDLSDGKLTVNSVPLLFEVPGNVTLKSFASISQSSSSSSAGAPRPLYQRVLKSSHMGGFLGFSKDQASSSDRLMNSLGKFSGRDFLSIFRFKTWWSTQWVGNSGSDLQMETQWVLLDVPEIRSYVIIIPIIEGKFRSALHPGADGHVMICAESGSTQVKASSFDAIAYVHASENPYELMKQAYAAVRVHLDTFKLLEEKSVPPMVNKFGWCTWDAFYLTVDPAGVWQGVKEFADGGLSPRFLIIDDGWQSISLDSRNPHEDARNLVLGGTQMTARLHRLDEGKKFRKYRGGSMLGANPPRFDPKRPKMLISKAIEIEQAEKARDKAAASGVSELSELESRIGRLKNELEEMFGGDQEEEDKSCGRCSCSNKSENLGLKAFTGDLRSCFKGLDDIYVWQALCGAWGGVRPGATQLESKVIPCKTSPGLDGTMTDLAVVKIVEGGIGLVHPDQVHDFYHSMHSYLSQAGITGVKVDVIHSLEYVCEEYGGRVELAKAYYDGLSKSLANNFNGTGLISSMQQCNDFFLLGTRQISLGRVGDDFWFQDPNGDPNGVYWLQGVHMIHCAYNSMWMGQMIQPDWDMFQSDHLCAKFHAGSRAICGGPVYVSDSLEGHDFDLLKKLVYPDGTIPRCQHFALPTRDCLFKNPLFDGNTILKIWNFNRYGGVIGAFNCQGAGWDPKEQRIRGHSECYKPVSGWVHATQIEWGQTKEASEMGEAPEYAVYLSQAGKLFLTTPASPATEITVEPSSFEICSFVPTKELRRRRRRGTIARFAPIGLTNMFNSGGTIEALRYDDDDDSGVVDVEVKGGGNFLAYSSVPPEKCYLGGAETGFQWSADDGKLVVNLAWNGEANGISLVTFVF